MVRLDELRRAPHQPALGRPAPAGRARPGAGEPPAGPPARRAARRARPQAARGDAGRAASASRARSAITFIYVTHDQDEALSMSDRLAVFSNGRIEQVGTPAEVYERPASAFVAGFVGTSNILEGDLARAPARRARPVHGPTREDPLVAVDAGPVDPARRDPGHRARCASTQYLGDRTRYVVDLDGGGRARRRRAEPRQLRRRPGHVARQRRAPGVGPPLRPAAPGRDRSRPPTRDRHRLRPQRDGSSRGSRMTSSRPRGMLRRHDPRQGRQADGGGHGRRHRRRRLRQQQVATSGSGPTPGGADAARRSARARARSTSSPGPATPRTAPTTRRSTGSTRSRQQTGCKVNVKIGNTSDEMVQLMKTGAVRRRVGVG